MRYLVAEAQAPSSPIRRTQPPARRRARDVGRDDAGSRRRRHDDAVPRHRRQEHRRPGACDLSQHSRARRASGRQGDGPIRPVAGDAGGFATGIVATSTVALGCHWDSTTLVVVGLALVGASSGTVILARAAAADMYPKERRARGISLVLFGAVFGAALGPLVFKPLFGDDHFVDTDARRPVARRQPDHGRRSRHRPLCAP